jgi:hypothetical protein
MTIRPECLRKLTRRSYSKHVGFVWVSAFRIQLPVKWTGCSIVMWSFQSAKPWKYSFWIWTKSLTSRAKLIYLRLDGVIFRGALGGTELALSMLLLFICVMRLYLCMTFHEPLSPNPWGTKLKKYVQYGIFAEYLVKHTEPCMRQVSEGAFLQAWLWPVPSRLHWSTWFKSRPVFLWISK